MMENNIQFRQIGRLDQLPDPVLEEVDRTLAETRGNTGLTLVLALNYGSRAEITDAVRAIAEQVKRGGLEPRDIDENVISNHLYTRGMPDPDLLIRTGGEHRLSNFLLWQSAYTELYFTPTLWPDFTVEHLREAINEYASRERRYGTTGE